MLFFKKSPVVALVLACAALQAGTTVLPHAPERSAAEVYRESQQLTGANFLRMVTGGPAATHVDQLAPEWLKVAPSGWSVEDESFTYRAPSANATKFCADWAEQSSRIEQCTAADQSVQVTVPFTPYPS